MVLRDKIGLLSEFIEPAVSNIASLVEVVQGSPPRRMTPPARRLPLIDFMLRLDEPHRVLLPQARTHCRSGGRFGL